MLLGVLIIRDQLLGSPVAPRIGRRFLSQRLILGITIQHFNVLVYGTCVVLQPRQDGNQAAPQSRRLLALGGLQAVREEITQALVVVLAGIGIGHGGHVFRLERGLRQQRVQEPACPVVVPGLGSLARRLQRERIAIRRLGPLCGLRQDIDGPLGVAVPQSVRLRADQAIL